MRTIQVSFKLLLLLLALVACRPKSSSSSTPKNEKKLDKTGFEFQSSIKHAQLFTIEKKGNYKIVKVLNPWEKDGIFAEYLLLPPNEKAPQDLSESTTIVQVPAKNLISLSNTQIGPIKLLGIEDLLIGGSHQNFLYDQEILKKYKSGEVINVGDGMQVNTEAVISLNPGIIFRSGFLQIKEQDKMLRQAKMPLAYVLEWMEQTPLARAEWLKFYAAFFNKEAEADSIFNSMEKEYRSLVTLSQKAEKKPSVFCGFPYKGTWYMPGGQSYKAQLLRDAGASYHWYKDSTSGSMPLSFEVVLENHLKNDIWLDAKLHSLGEIAKADPRYKLFQAWQQDQVFAPNGRVNGQGGNDFWETGVSNPHLVLKDLIAILHPEIFPDHQLYYYNKLTNNH